MDRIRIKQPSLFFRIHRWLYFVLKGRGKKEEEHYLFTLEEPLTDLELYQRLADTGWTPNYIGFPYQGQIYQCRRLLHHGKHQLHVRCYDDGKITGHYEIAIEFDEKQHLAGVDLRTMNEREAARLRTILLGNALKYHFSKS